MPPHSCPRAPVSSRTDVHPEDDISTRDWKPGAPHLQLPTGRATAFQHTQHHHSHQSNAFSSSRSAASTTSTTTLPSHPPTMIHRRTRTPPRESAARRRHARNSPFQAKLAQMKIRLSPIVQISTGAVHPAFPRTLLNFWLLTEEQLDSLALFYHQRYPNELTMAYPCPVEWPATGLTIADKRRKMGRFIGLRGCESPIVMVKSEEEIRDEVRKQAAKEEEELRMREKLSRGYFHG